MYSVYYILLHRSWIQIYLLWVDSVELCCIYALAIAIITVRIIVGCCLTAGFSGSSFLVHRQSESCDEFVSSSSSSVWRFVCVTLSVVLRMIVAGEWQSQGELCVDSTVAVCVSVWQSSTPRTSSVWVNDCCGCVRQSSFGHRWFGPMRQRFLCASRRPHFVLDGCVPGFPGVVIIFVRFVYSSVWVKLSHLRVYLIECAVFDTCISYSVRFSA